MPAAISADI
jgi:hypothetical protein